MAPELQPSPAIRPVVSRRDLLARLALERLSETEIETPAGRVLVGCELACARAYRRGWNHRGDELAAFYSQGDVEAGLRELAAYDGEGG